MARKGDTVMKKDFKKWHNRKEDINDNKARPFSHEGEVWFCSLGANVGFEQDGIGANFLRPVLILRKFNQEICWGVPLTRNQKKSKYYFAFDLNGERSVAILSQIRLIDGKRLQYKIGSISQTALREIKKRLIRLLE